MTRRHAAPRIEVTSLPPDVQATIDDAIAGRGEGRSIVLTRAGARIATLEVTSDVLEGTVVEGPHEPAPTTSPQDGATVVATAMTLSDDARRRLCDGLGAAYVVLDLHDAPASADVLLTHPVSPQLLGILRQQFPSARIVVTEVEDDGLGVHYPGPVTRLLDAGASAYLPPRPVAEVAANVHAYLTRDTGPMIGSGDPGPRRLPASRTEP